MTKRKITLDTPQPARRAAIYLRVSTDDQAQHGYGLEVQREKCNAMASVKGWDVIAEYKDEGVSGTTEPEQRPAMAQLLAAVDAGQIDAVLVLALDRLGRKTRIVLELAERFGAQNVELVSVKELLDTSTATGEFVLTMFAALAQLERSTIVNRTTEGRNARGRIDGEKGGRLPYGYYRNTADNNAVEIDLDAANIVRMIFRHRRAGKGMQAIADTLNLAGYASPKGGQWYASSVKIILDNKPAYAGGERGESSVCWPAII